MTVSESAGTDRGTDVAEPDAAPAPRGAFVVHLDAFEGPFDLLLQLIASRRLDVTEVALSEVTDDFLAHLRAAGEDLDLEEATSFLVVAATLLDWKAARLLPGAEVEDADDLDRLEARDLLFARLLAYRAFQQAAALLAALLESGSRVHLRAVPPPAEVLALLPEVELPSPQRLAEVAARALTPRPAPQVAVEHVHVPHVDVEAEARTVRERLAAAGGALNFAALVAGATPLETVARFLALLDLFRERVVGLDQPEALGPLVVRLEAAA